MNTKIAESLHRISKNISIFCDIGSESIDLLSSCYQIKQPKPLTAFWETSAPMIKSSFIILRPYGKPLRWNVWLPAVKTPAFRLPYQGKRLLKNAVHIRQKNCGVLW